MIYKAPLSS